MSVSRPGLLGGVAKLTLTRPASRHLLRIWLRNEEYALDHGEGLDRKWAGLKAAETESFPLEAWDKAPRQS